MKTVSSRFTAADTGTTDTGTIDAMGIIGPKDTIGLIVTIDTATIAGRDSTSTSGPGAITAISDITGDAERNHTRGAGCKASPSCCLWLEPNAKRHEIGGVFFRAADVCVVSSLHDGMNLVAKEFVASRDDEQGVPVLSSFAGASRELSGVVGLRSQQRIVAGVSRPY